MILDPKTLIRGPWCCWKTTNRPWFQFAVQKPDGTWARTEDQNLKAASRKATELRDQLHSS